MSPISPSHHGYTLWHRRSKYFRWREVATGTTEAELTARLLKLPSGDYLTLPTGENPNDRTAKRSPQR